MTEQHVSIENQGKLQRDLGFFTATAIGVSQMIGTGIYMAPQGLAQMSNPITSLVACLIVGIGTLLIALSFSKVGEKMPVSGSSVVYTKAAFGDTASFFVGWSFLWSNLTGVAAIITGTLAYGSYFMPGLKNSNLMAFLAGCGILWIYTLINIRGIKQAGNVNLVLTIIKLLPLVAFFIFAAINFNPQNFSTVSADSVKGMGVLPITIGYLMWSFLGFEGITINAGEIKNKSIVKKATLASALFVTVIYFIFIILSSGSMDQASLAQSTSPVADVIAKFTGAKSAGTLIAVGVFISGLACVGAWITSSSRITYAVAEQGLFPITFAKVNKKHNTPVNALLFDAVVCTIVLMLNFVTGLVGLFNFLLLITTMASLIFYAFGVASEIMLVSKKEKNFNALNFIKNSFLSLVAFGYIVYAIYGTGATNVLYGFLFILVGIPFYIYIKTKNGEAEEIRKAAELE